LNSNTFAFNVGELEDLDVAGDAGESAVVGFVNEDDGILHVAFVRVID
jgi:hypothetical protein